MRRAYLLAGGRSRRFGVDKARVLVQGESQIQRLSSGLSRNGWQVAIVAQSVADYRDVGLEVINDLQPHAGPLAGVIAALTDFQTFDEAYCLIANVDLVVWSWDWLQAMERLALHEKPSVVLFRSNEFMPMPGLYASDVIESALEVWRDGKRSLRDLHESLVGSISTLDWPINARPQSFNTPEELRAILDHLPAEQ